MSIDFSPEIGDMCEDYECLLIDILGAIDPSKNKPVEVTQSQFDAWKERFCYAGYSWEALEDIRQEKAAREQMAWC